jgi:hypothetical protein
MDIQELAKTSYNRTLTQKMLEEKQLSRLVVSYSNGLWVCNTELICLLYSFQNQDEIILLDSNKIPRKVNTKELLDISKARYQEVLNDWLIEYNQLAKVRTIRHVLE